MLKVTGNALLAYRCPKFAFKAVVTKVLTGSVLFACVGDQNEFVGCRAF
jgi:hypothetical protein